MAKEGSFGALFTTQLEAVGDAGKEHKLTACELVRRCLPEIRRARKNHYTWDAIARTLQGVAEQQYGEPIKIAPSTAKRTYYKLTRQPKSRRPTDSRQSVQRTTSPQSKPQAELPPFNEAVNVAPETPQVSALLTEIPETSSLAVEEKPAKEGDAAQGRSSKRQPQKTRFNLSSRPGAKPINIL